MSQTNARVVVSGAPGLLAAAVAEAIDAAEDLSLVGVYNPHRQGEWLGVPYVDKVEGSGVDVVVETGPDSSVMDNLGQWHRAGVAAVVGTSGFTSAKLDELAQLWGDEGPGCLVVPNFSIGAVLSTRFAE